MTLCWIQWMDCGGGGGSLLNVWPVGVLMVMVYPSGSAVLVQPGDSLT